jgi:hypothetical protein
MCRAGAQPAADPNSPLSSSTMGRSPSSCTNTIVDPSEPSKLQHTLPSQYEGHPLIPVTLRGGLASPTASLPAEDTENLTLQREQPFRPSDTEITTTRSTTTQELQAHGPSAPRLQHRPDALPAAPPASTTTTSTSSGTPNMTPSRRLRRQAPPSHAQKDEVLTLRVPRDKCEVPRHDTPRRESDAKKRRHHDHRQPVKAFARMHYTCRLLVAMVEAYTPPPFTAPPPEWCVCGHRRYNTFRSKILQLCIIIRNIS